LAEKVDEQESDDAQGTGGRAAVDAGDDASAHVGRSDSVSNGIAIAGNDVTASDGDPDQVTDAETDVAGRQENQRPFRISESRPVDEESGEGECRRQGSDGSPQSHPQRGEPLLVLGEERIGTRQQTIGHVSHTQRSIEARIAGVELDERRSTLTLAVVLIGAGLFVHALAFVGSFAEFGEDGRNDRRWRPLAVHSAAEAWHGQVDGRHGRGCW